jgi:hypothetical protein
MDANREMLARMEANEERMDARIEAKNEKFEVLQGTLVSRTGAHHAKTQANHEELMAAMKASHERIEAPMDVSLAVTEACLVKAKEPTSVEMKSIAVHEEVPKELAEH